MASASASSTSGISTYHCAACSTLLLSTIQPLSSFSTQRTVSEDRAFHLPVSTPSETTPAPVQWLRLLDATADDAAEDEAAAAVIVRLQSAGYEKRWLRRCGECRCVVGYALGGDQDNGGVYVLPDAVVETEELKRDLRERKERRRERR